MVVSRFFYAEYLEPNSNGKAAAKEVGVRPILLWWRRRESNSRPKINPYSFLRVQAIVKIPSLTGQSPNPLIWYPHNS